MLNRCQVLAVALLSCTTACSKGMPLDAEANEREVRSRTADTRNSALSVGRLRWDASERPSGMLRLEPRLDWQLASGEREQQQTAYQVLVASNAALLAAGTPDLWDSGKVPSAESVGVAYRGPELLARQFGFWTVRAWNRQDRPSAYAEPVPWEVGPWDEEVEGDWIGRASNPSESALDRERSVSYFRRAFTIPVGFRAAKLYATAFGLYELRINGAPVTEDVLTPGFSDYEKRVLVQTRDVTALVRAGDNVLGATLAGGWCTARLHGVQGRCGIEPPRLRVALEITLPDGKLETIESDDAWKYSAGPLTSAQLFEGESYDARREMPGWDAPGFDDRSWRPAAEYDGDTERNVYPDPGAPIRIAAEQPALALSEPTPGSYVFDLGRTIVGWARLSIDAPVGTSVTLRYGEALQKDGALATGMDRARDAVATDRYVVGRSGTQTWEPRFSVRKFRYVELRGLLGRPALTAITGRPVHSDMPLTGTLQTSDERLNRLFSNILAQQERAFVSVPSLGQGGMRKPGALLNAQLFALTSCLNRDVQRFYRKWLEDIRDSQLLSSAYTDAAPLSAGRESGAAGSAGVLVPWALYRCYGDRTALDAHVSSMGRWLDAVVAKNPDLVWRKELGGHPGDPLESAATTNPALLATAELSYSADSLARMLLSGGSSLVAEGERFQKLAQDSRAAFNTVFVLPDGKLESDTQTAYAVAIARGMLDGAVLERAGQHLAAAVERAERRPTTGTIGTALLLPALSRVGRDNLAYDLLQRFAEPNETLPRGLEFGALGEWMYDAIGGIALDPAAPAGRHVLVRPRPGAQLTHARASFASLYGLVETAWSLQGGTFRLHVTIPVGSSATVSIPYPGAVSEAGAPAETSNGVKSVTKQPTNTVIEIASGGYDFSVDLPGVGAP